MMKTRWKRGLLGGTLCLFFLTACDDLVTGEAYTPQSKTLLKEIRLVLELPDDPESICKDTLMDYNTTPIRINGIIRDDTTGTQVSYTTVPLEEGEIDNKQHYNCSDFDWKVLELNVKENERGLRLFTINKSAGFVHGDTCLLHVDKNQNSVGVYVEARSRIKDVSPSGGYFRLIGCLEGYQSAITDVEGDPSLWSTMIFYLFSP